MKSNISAIVFAIAIISSSLIFGKAYLSRAQQEGSISVTGLGNEDFTSDLIVWDGSFVSEDMDLKKAYNRLEADKKTIGDYLTDKGIADDIIVFSAVDMQEKVKNNYSVNGNYIGQEFDGYSLSQQVKIESQDVEKVEKISREITELLNLGVQFYSRPPRYYYTKLADLKIEMISKATEDARVRAEKIAEHSGGKLGDLESARMGVFQITAPNSDENYSWGGTYNTESKKKTATITMKLIYSVD